MLRRFRVVSWIARFELDIIEGVIDVFNSICHGALNTTINIIDCFINDFNCVDSVDIGFFLVFLLLTFIRYGELEVE